MATMAVFVLGALSFTAANAAIRTKPQNTVLTTTTDFTITSTISDSPTSATPSALLYPGVTDYLWYTASNPLSLPITVVAMSIASTTPPSNCATSNLDLAKTAFASSLVVPANGAITETTPQPILLIDTATNQDGCEGSTFTFTFTGVATYTDPTTTVLTSSPNTSSSGQSVSFAATVTAANPGIDPSGPTGSVTFDQCAAVTCASSRTVLGSVTVGSNDQAGYLTSSLPVGTWYIEAIYRPTDPTSFIGSTSNIIAHVINVTPGLAPSVGGTIPPIPATSVPTTSPPTTTITSTPSTISPTSSISPTTTIAPAISAARAANTGATRGNGAADRGSQSAAKEGPVTAATSAHTGEPWAGSGPLAAGLAAVGLLFIVIGLRRHHRLGSGVR